MFSFDSALATESEQNPWNSPTASTSTRSPAQSPSPFSPNPRGETRLIKKKAKRVRTAFTTSQLLALEARYKEEKYLSREGRGDMAQCFGIGDRQIKIWFQNRRMKDKKSGKRDNTEKQSPKEPYVPTKVFIQRSPKNSSFTDSGVSDFSDIDALLSAENSPYDDHTEYLLPEQVQYPEGQSCQKSLFLETDYYAPESYGQWKSAQFYNTGVSGWNGEWNSDSSKVYSSANGDGYCQQPYMPAYDGYCYSGIDQQQFNTNYQHQYVPPMYYECWNNITNLNTKVSEVQM